MSVSELEMKADLDGAVIPDFVLHKTRIARKEI